MALDLGRVVASSALDVESGHQALVNCFRAQIEALEQLRQDHDHLGQAHAAALVRAEERESALAEARANEERSAALVAAAALERGAARRIGEISSFASWCAPLPELGFITALALLLFRCCLGAWLGLAWLGLLFSALFEWCCTLGSVRWV